MICDGAASSIWSVLRLIGFKHSAADVRQRLQGTTRSLRQLN